MSKVGQSLERCGANSQDASHSVAQLDSGEAHNVGKTAVAEEQRGNDQPHLRKLCKRLRDRALTRASLIRHEVKNGVEDLGT